eukprot:gene21291-27314_t
MVTAGRARPERLEAAINELNKLNSDLISETINPGNEQTAAPRMSKKVTAIMQDVNSDIFALKHSALSLEASRLRRDQADLSNMLVKVDPGTPCPDLVDKILELHHKIEDIWDQKNFLDRNQNDGPANPEHDQQQNREKRSKLKSKMANPRASMALKSKWEIELAQVEAIIEETEMKRAVL